MFKSKTTAIEIASIVIAIFFARMLLSIMFLMFYTLILDLDYGSIVKLGITTCISYIIAIQVQIYLTYKK